MNLLFTLNQVFVWEVPSGRLLHVLEFPSDSDHGIFDLSSSSEYIEKTIRTTETKEGIELKDSSSKAEIYKNQLGLGASSGYKDNEDAEIRRGSIPCLREDTSPLYVSENNKSNASSGRDREGDIFASNNTCPAPVFFRPNGTTQCHPSLLRSNITRSCRLSSLASSAAPPYVAAIQVLHIAGHLYHVYVGYGNGTVAVFNIQTAECLTYWMIPGNESIISIEMAPHIGCVLILSGNKKLTIWSCNDFRLIET